MDGFSSKFQKIFLRAPNFISDKNLDRTWSVGHGPLREGQNLVRTSPPKLLDGMTSNFQNILLRVPRFARFFFVRLSVCLSKILNIFVWWARPKFFLDNSSIMAGWIRLKISGNVS